MSFVRVAAVAELPAGTVRAFDLNGVDVAVANTDEGFFAIEDRCSHSDVPLSEGDVSGCTLECYLHGSRFDLRTGKPLEPPAVVGVPIFPVKVEGPDLFVDPDQPIQFQEQ